MPCYDHRSTYEYGRQEAQEEIDKMARWLCSILGALEKSGLEFDLVDEELKTWWEDHKKFDEKKQEAV